VRVGLVIASLGDLVEDIAVRLVEPVNVASDTPAVIRRRRGGSAANMAVAVARLGRPSRFIGQVGDDPVGDMLVAELRRAGVEPVVGRGGRSGTIVVLVDQHGERTMLTDRGCCADLGDPDPCWLDDVAALHVPAYSLVGGSLATTSTTLVAWAHERHALVSVDLSSAALIDELGPSVLGALIGALEPDLVLANELEAERFGGPDRLVELGARVTVVKQGSQPALVHVPGAGWNSVDACRLDEVHDTTGAGDAFAAGAVSALVDGLDPVTATAHGHQAAAAALARLVDG
jgi:sugar/nucleoside kinase (ribokinase family)